MFFTVDIRHHGLPDAAARSRQVRSESDESRAALADSATRLLVRLARKPKVNAEPSVTYANSQDEGFLPESPIKAA
jgi:hypothetical protein